MRIYLMLSYDVIFKPQLLYQLLLKCPGHIVGVGEVRKASGYANEKKTKQKKEMSPLGFWGVKGTTYLAATVLLRKFSSAMPLPHYVRSRATIKRVSRLFGVPYDLVDDVNDPQFLESLRLLEPDVVVSFQHQIFKEPLLNLPNIACINCHPAKLPKYRGVKPIFWAMLNGDKEIGVTVHTMDADIDTGRILSQKSFPVLPDSTLMDNYVMAYALSVDVIKEALERIGENNDLATFPLIQPSEFYYRHPQIPDVGNFRSAGLKII